MKYAGNPWNTRESFALLAEVEALQAARDEAEIDFDSWEARHEEQRERADKAEAALTEARAEHADQLQLARSHYDAKVKFLRAALEQAQTALGEIAVLARQGGHDGYVKLNSLLSQIAGIARAALAGQTTDTAADGTATDGGSEAARSGDDL